MPALAVFGVQELAFERRYHLRDRGEQQKPGDQVGLLPERCRRLRRSILNNPKTVEDHLQVVGDPPGGLGLRGNGLSKLADGTGAQRIKTLEGRDRPDSPAAIDLGVQGECPPQVGPARKEAYVTGSLNHLGDSWRPGI